MDNHRQTHEETNQTTEYCMTVYIEKSDSTHRYNWVVRVGRGRGSSIKSRHRKKQRATSRGREIARKRGDVLKEQMQAGYWRTVTSYG